MALSLRVLLFLLVSVWSALAADFTVVVSGSPSHIIPETLYGMMFEDISHSGDGGLYAEMLQNRAFQQVAPNTPTALNSWSAANNAHITVVDNTTPLSDALPNSLQLTVPTGLTGDVGVQNSGYFGINVNTSWTYNASFYYKLPTGSTFKGPFTVALKSTSGKTLASASVTVNASPDVWTQATVQLKPTSSATSTSNVFTVTVDAASASDQTVYLSLFSLFPPTFKNRPNGMRVDIATTLQEAGPSFFRFPGGNNIEGQTTAQRWIWNNTIGPLTERPGRLGDWGYINTDGLGLLEYLLFVEDMGMESIMAVWAGYSLDGTSLPETDLAPFIQAAKDQIDFVVADPSVNAMGAKRAALGHPAPFTLNYVEVGNEDFFSNTYAYRWKDFVNSLSAIYPHITFIATGLPNNPRLTPNPKSWDIHVYQTPEWFAQNTFTYDEFQRDGTKYFEGEYAVTSTNPNNLFGTPSQGRLTYPTMQGAAGEAAFMTGFERNADIVFAASYAPLLGSVDNNQWTPNLVGFNAKSVILSTSYYAQQMFSLNRGDVYLPSTLPSSNGAVFWSVTRRKATNEVLIKISNTDTAASTITFKLPYDTVAPTAIATVLTGPATTSNTPESPDAIVPTTSTIPISGKTFSYTAAPISVNVISVVAH